jgi:large subunit ribosomal protein L19
MQDLLNRIEKNHLKAKEPDFQTGDTVKVKVLIREGKKERSQIFEGLVIAIKGGGINKTFTVRRIFQNIGIERTFLMHSPKVQEVTVIRQGRTRRAKLFYLRKLIGNKATRLKEDKRRKINVTEETAAPAEAVSEAADNA